MKFISKSSNYMVVLKPGIQGNSLTGQASVPGLYVRFRDGITEIKDEEMVRLMKASEGFRNGDFIAADDHGEDPFADTRSQTEPTHVISEIKYGHVEGRKVSDTPVKLPATVKKMIEAEAKKMAKEMAQEMVKEMMPSILKDLSLSSQPETAQSKLSTPVKDKPETTK